jgi:hypothetical protein
MTAEFSGIRRTVLRAPESLHELIDSIFIVDPTIKRAMLVIQGSEVWTAGAL